MSERRHIRIEYRVRDDVELDVLHAAIKDFVAGMKAHDASHDYTSYRDLADPRHYVHVGQFSPEVVPGLQAQAFFQTFTARLKGWCAVPPEVTNLAPVASTH